MTKAIGVAPETTITGFYASQVILFLMTLSAMPNIANT
jgi:hypothetical protein